MAKRLLRLKQIIGPPNPRIPVCRSMFYEMLNGGLIPPAAVRIGRAVFWTERQIDDAVADLVDKGIITLGQEAETGEVEEIPAHEHITTPDTKQTAKRKTKAKSITDERVIEDASSQK